MKIRKSGKTAFFFLLVLTFQLVLTGCAKEEVVPADQVASAFYKLVILLEPEDIKAAYAYTDEDIETLMSTQRDGSIQQVKNNLSSIGFEAEDEDAAKLYEAQMAAFKNLTFTSEITEETKNTATVLIKTDYININELNEKAAADSIAQYGQENLVDEDAMNELLHIYLEAFSDSLKNAAPVTDQSEITVKFTKQKVDSHGKIKTVWAPEDGSSFGSDLITAVSGR